MKSRKAITIAISLLVISSFVLAACGTDATNVVVEENTNDTTTVEQPDGDGTTTEPVVDEGPVTYRATSTTDIPTLDPQLGEDVVSINWIENLFVHLTNYDLETAEIVPEAATSWEISDDGLIYTFTIRTDIPWVNYNPSTGETTQEVDDDGNPRFVTAHDFAYGVQRACDSDTGGYYSSIIAPNIKGCEAVLFADDPDALTEEDFANIGATALDDETLQIELAFRSGYFLSMTPMWTLAAVPQWAVEEHDDNWVEAGFIVTNGRYVLAEWVHGVSRVAVRNPLMPADMAGDGNVERFEIDVVPDISTSYALWLNGEIEFSAIPSEELENHLANYGDETVQIPDLAVFYFGFASDKAPFDDPLVRAAFSAALDRELLVETVFQGQGLPMKHFAPPGIFGAPPIDEVGVGFNPEWAAEQLAAAGYPGCEGFPEITLLGYSGANTLSWIEFAQANWSENLGCDAELISIEQLPFRELLDVTKPESGDRPNMWTLGWGPDYGDENNWAGDVLYCSVNPRLERPCEEVDELIDAARIESDPAVRIELYAEIEELFFGEGGIFPMAPLYVRIAFVAQHSWFDRIPALFGGQQWYTYTIDASMQP